MPGVIEEEQGEQCDCSRVSGIDKAGGCRGKGGGWLERNVGAS